MNKNLYQKNSLDKKILNNLVTPIKYKEINLISLNKYIKIPIIKFNSLANISTSKKSNSLSIKMAPIPKNKNKNKYFPSIKKFNDSLKIKSRNSIINLKSFMNKTNKTNDCNKNNIKEKFISLKLKQNSKRDLDISNINKFNEEKTRYIFSPIKFNNISFSQRNTVDISKSFGIKKKPITIGESEHNGEKIKSIFRKKNINIKLEMINNDINKNYKIKLFKNNKNNINNNVISRNNNIILLNKTSKKYNDNIILLNNTSKINNDDNIISMNNINIDKENIITINNNKDIQIVKDKFMKFLIKKDNGINNGNKKENIDIIKINLINKSKKVIENILNEEFQNNNNNNKLFKENNNNINNINESLKDIFYKKANNIYTITNQNKNTNTKIHKVFNTFKYINPKVNTNDIINKYLSIRYKSKEVFFNFIQSLNLRKSKSLQTDYNLLEMKLLHINVEYEFNLKDKSKNTNSKSNTNKSLKSKSKTLYKNKPHIIQKKRDSIKNEKLSEITTDKFWKKFSLLKNASFFKNQNEKIFIKKYFSKKRTMNIKRYKSRRTIIKKLLKKDCFEKLKYLIYNKDENQFKYECSKIIKNYDINTYDKDGNNLLILACMNGDIKIIKYLLDNGANPNSVNLTRNTPLHYALVNHEYDIADLLIKNGAKENLVNINGLTPW